MKQSTSDRRELWVDAFKGPGLCAAFGAIIGFAMEFSLGLPGDGAGFGTTIGLSFFTLPGIGAAIGGGVGALWMQTRPSVKRMKSSLREKDSS